MYTPQHTPRHPTSDTQTELKGMSGAICYHLTFAIGSRWQASRISVGSTTRTPRAQEIVKSLAIDQ